MTSEAILPVFEAGPLDRLMLALYAGASGDHNRIHLDSDAARAAGLPGAIVHGMLLMAILSRALGHWFDRGPVRHLQVRFVAPAMAGDRLSCTGAIRRLDAGVAHVDLEARVETRLIMTGQAVVGLRAPAAEPSA